MRQAQKPSDGCLMIYVHVEVDNHICHVLSDVRDIPQRLGGGKLGYSIIIYRPLGMLPPLGLV